MADSDIALMAHLLRRAGFGATREELESYVAKGYEATVEELLKPQDSPERFADEDLVRRYHPEQISYTAQPSSAAYWIYRMMNTNRPLEEKIALFWHGILAAGFTKTNNPKAIMNQLHMFRRYGLGSFPKLLLELSKDPAMLYWLDQHENHKDAVNENYGRELLELFSLGVGMDGHPNYTEDDVRQCSRAFTGWTIRNAGYMAARAAVCSTYPYGKLDWQFVYMDDDHDDGEKTFLGQTGRFNGEDIIDIIVRQPAAARFVCRHLYNFFVADEPQVPAWQTVPPRDPEAIRTMENAYMNSQYEIRSVLRAMFNSDFFKNAAFAKVKSPAELVVGAARQAGDYRYYRTTYAQLVPLINFMGQMLGDPPSVEGWHTGTEWINTASLVDRINYAVEEFGDADKPGVRSIINRIRALGPTITPDGLVDACLDLMGPITVSESTRQEIVDHVAAAGELRFGSKEEARSSIDRVTGVLQLIVSSREYQLA